LASCNDTEEAKKKTFKCDVFDIENGISISSEFKIDSLATIIQYEKNDIDKVVDTIKTTVEDRTKYTKSNYVIRYRPLNTGYDYQIILNDTLRFFVTDLNSKMVSHGTEFMQGARYMCEISSYKLNGIKREEAQIVIDTANKK
jgi:hypothetical protein